MIPVAVNRYKAGQIRLGVSPGLQLSEVNNQTTTIPVAVRTDDVRPCCIQ